MKNIEEITIRPVTEADAEKLLAIYAPYVTDTFVTYEYTVPTVEEFRERIRNTLQAYPYFAAVENGRIIGYAYASAFHPRRAYLWSAEATVYLERGVRGRGVGRLLYERLEEALKQQNVQNVNACIAYWKRKNTGRKFSLDTVILTGKICRYYFRSGTDFPTHHS